jgi:hypothetical protein
MKLQLQALTLSVLSICTLQALADSRTSTTSITQDGSRSVATITQTPFSLYGLTADIYQGRGVDNYATVLQGGLEAHATITQLDNHQAARVVQNTDGSHATVWQGGGSGNSADVSQSGAHGVSITVRQFGTDNSSIVTQDGAFGAHADIRQTGTGNSSIVTQDGAFGAHADVRQTGTGNQTTVNESGFFGDEQRATVEQNGVNNQASIELPAAAGQATITQYGTNNAASIRDQGLNNASLIDQRGANNLAQIDLTGSFIDATIRQRGIGNRGYVTSVGDGFSSAQMNTATILQGGQDNLARITQASASNAGYTAVISQNYSAPGYGNVATILQR